MANIQASYTKAVQPEQNWSRTEWLVSVSATIGIAVLIVVVYMMINDTNNNLLSGLSTPEPGDVVVASQATLPGQHGDAQPGKSTPGGESQHDHMQFVEQLNKRLAKNPDDFESMFLLANTHMMIRDFNKAEKLYAAVLSLSPGHLDARSNLALIALQRGHFKESVKLLEANLRDNPEHGESVYNLGFIYASYLNDAEAAIKLWDNWLTDNPSHPVNEQLKPMHEQLLQVKNNNTN